MVCNMGKRKRRLIWTAQFSMEVMTDKGDKVLVSWGNRVTYQADSFLGSREALCYMGINNRTGAIIRNNISVGILVLYS